ncbi:MAG: outer membrane beta-barrel protein [Pseudomonadota bacterium]
MNIKSLAIAAGILTFAGNLSQATAADFADSGKAEASSKYYFAARLGAAFAEDSSFDLNAAAAVPTAIDNLYESSNIMGAIALGKNFGGGFRGEIEVSYGSSEIDAHTIVALPATLSGSSAFGDTSVLTGLVNGYYDFDLGGVSPYVSAGLGAARLDFDNHGVVIPAGGVAGLPAGPITALDDSGTGFAWQVGAGLNVEIDAITTFEIGYRYQSVENVELTAVDGTRTDVDFETHNIIGGLRFDF